MGQSFHMKIPECCKKLASKLWSMPFTLTYYFLIHTLSCFAAKKKVLVQAFTNCVHCYDHERNVHASDIMYTRKSAYVIDSSMLKLFEFTNLSIFFCSVFGRFYHVLLPARAINCENCQLSTGAINLSQFRTTSHPPTQTIRPTLKNCSFPITHIANRKSPRRPVKFFFLPYSN